MKRISKALVALIGLALSAGAQKGVFSVSAGPTLGLPLNKNFKQYFTNGVGAGARFHYNVTENSVAFLNVAHLFIGTQATNSNSLNLSSLKAGYKLYIRGTNVFVAADGGWYKYSGKNLRSNASFGFGGGLGYTIPVGKNNIDIDPSFERFTSPLNSDWLNIHIGYRINLQKTNE